MKRIMALMVLALLFTACQREEKKVELDKSTRLLVNFNGKYGYCDKGGIMVIPAQFDSASIFSDGW